MYTLIAGMMAHKFLLELYTIADCANKCEK